MTSWELIIPGWRPATVNELIAGGPWGAARLKKHDRDHVAVYARIDRIPRATGKRRVSLMITLCKGQRRWDTDALWKSLLDALVWAGMLIDDRPKWCELGPVEYARTGVLSTTISLDELPPEDTP